MYHHGKGLKQNYKKAIELYSFATNQENAFAQLNLGLMYSKGQEVKQDYSKAKILFKKSCDKGVNLASTEYTNKYDGNI